MWSNAAMTKQLDWEKRRFDTRPKTSIKDENQYRKGDMAARWIARAEQRLADQRKHTPKHKQKQRRRQRREPVQPVMRPRPADPGEKPPGED
jgi:hypothetical protein